MVSGQVALQDTEIVLKANVAGQAIATRCPVVKDSHAVMSLVQVVAEFLADQIHEAPHAIVHRVVHGGGSFREPVVVTDSIREQLNDLVDLAPLHQPVNLAAIDAMTVHYPDVLQVACFDTAFHANQSALETHYALPQALFERGIRKYGFHGLSYAYIVSQLGAYGLASDARVVICHLGNGASICAVQGGASVASTMGFTALEGLPMGSRCGRLDPGVVLHLIAQDGWSVDAVEHLLYYDSGLKGLSGVSSDVRTLESAADDEAAFALDYFSYRINAEIGALVAVLGGVDAIVFTAGIGENSISIRQKVCDRLARWLPLQLDQVANERQDEHLNTRDSQIRVLRIPTDENLYMARIAKDLIDAARHPL